VAENERVNNKVQQAQLTDDHDVGCAGGAAGDVGGTAGVDADVARLRSVDHQRTFAGLRVERGDVTARHQHQVRLVLEPRDLRYRDAGHGCRELARVALAHHARLDRSHEFGRLTAGPLHHLLHHGRHLMPRQQFLNYENTTNTNK